MNRAVWFCCALALALAAGPARADNLLEGPHPFLRDNELSLHGGYAAGFGDTFGGPKLVVDYGYKLERGIWLDLGVGLLSGVCRTRLDDPACKRTGDSAEVLGGIKWKLRMNVPVVPYLKAQAGLAFQFPEDTRNAWGLLLRGGIGATYFLYEWFGVGAELTASAGRAGYQDGATLSHALGGLDATLGAEVQF